MQIDDSRIRNPCERRDLVDDDVRLGLLAVIRPRLDPRWRMRRFVLAPERLSVDAVGEDLHRKGTVPQVRQHVRRHPDVVLDHVPLGDAVRGPKHFVKIGKRESAAGYLPSCVAVERSQGVQRRTLVRVLSPRGPLVPRGHASPRCATRTASRFGGHQDARRGAPWATAFRSLVAFGPGSFGRCRVGSCGLCCFCRLGSFSA